MKRWILPCVIAALVAAPGCKTAGGGDETPDKTKSSGGPYAKPGFTVMTAADNRIWVFRDGSKELTEFKEKGELVKFVTRPGAGPGGMTVRAPDSETILEYAVAKEGFTTFVRESRIWVFRPGTKDLAEFEKSGEPAKQVTRIGVGPMRMTVKGPDVETISEYVYTKSGFVTRYRDERLWVFRTGAKEVEEFDKAGELAKHVTKIGVGPGGISVKGPDAETILDYVVANDGFATFVREGRIWVFRPGTKDLAEFEKTGEPAKQVTRVGVGPMRMTVKGPDAETIDAYVAVMGARKPTAMTVAAPEAAETPTMAVEEIEVEEDVVEVELEESPYGKPGFVVQADEDGRLWIFREGSKELEEFARQGELAKCVTRPGAGPEGRTLKAPDSETILEYAAACDGFATFVREGRIWVFRPDSKDLEEFLKTGEPAKQVTRIGAGPMRMTVKGPDAETIDAYLGSP
jgi:hypothetical protein